jgi:glycosyltransferase involved in cell wall biosynthesis
VSKIICVILPTLNKEIAIDNVIEEISQRTQEEMGYQFDVMVVDGLSTGRAL